MLPAGCEAGQIELRSAPPEAESSTGGDVGTGGLVQKPPTAQTGGMIQNIGGGGPTPNEPDDDLPYPLPCLVTSACFAFCDEDRPGCTPCDRDSECPNAVPLCDASLDRCVECLDDRDCENTFGPFFDECSLGLCVQCQRDEHCPPGDRCDHGWCGHCDSDVDCPYGMACFGDHCVPEP